MDELIETGFRETAQPGSATAVTVLLSVDEAAGILGISPQAVRKRITKGQLPARRDGRAWLVMLEHATSETETGATAPQPNETSGAQPRNLVAQQQAEQMAALVASIQAPLLDRIEAANREAERERAGREIAERERDELRAQVELLEEIQRVKERPADVVESDAAQDQRTAPTVAPGRAEPPESTSSTFDEPSIVAGWLRRLFGRS